MNTISGKKYAKTKIIIIHTYSIISTAILFFFVILVFQTLSIIFKFYKMSVLISKIRYNKNQYNLITKYS